MLNNHFLSVDRQLASGSTKFNLRSQPAYEESTRVMALHSPLLATVTVLAGRKQELSAVILCSKRCQPTLARSNICGTTTDHVMDRASCTLSNTTEPPKWFIRASSATPRPTSATSSAAGRRGLSIRQLTSDRPCSLSLGASSSSCPPMA
jgi:hypothetical protein